MILGVQLSDINYFHSVVQPSPLSFLELVLPPKQKLCTP